MELAKRAGTSDGQAVVSKEPGSHEPGSFSTERSGLPGENGPGRESLRRLGHFGVVVDVLYVVEIVEHVEHLLEKGRVIALDRGGGLR